jgi:quercetin dioxygenase-like cupin family protein
MFSSKQGTLRALLLVSVLCFGSAARAAEWSPLLPEQLNWIESPAYPGVTFAVLAGGMGKPGFFTVRAKFPPNYQLGPHIHTDDRGLTILVGSWKQGIGTQFDAAKAVAMPAGSFVLIPANQVHFDIAGPQGATVQVTGMGESKTEYLDAADDPKTRYGR